MLFFMLPFEEEGVYCFANVGRSIRPIVLKFHREFADESMTLMLDCTNAQADLELHCPHMADDK